MDEFYRQLWIGIGLLGQLCFFMRFLVQWIVSEKRKQSVIPVVFWHFSIAGGAILLAYSISIRDPVFIIGQSVGLVVYTRNLMLIRRERKATEHHAARQGQSHDKRQHPDERDDDA